MEKRKYPGAKIGGALFTMLLLLSVCQIDTNVEAVVTEPAIIIPTPNEEGDYSTSTPTAPPVIVVPIATNTLTPTPCPLLTSGFSSTSPPQVLSTQAPLDVIVVPTPTPVCR